MSKKKNDGNELFEKLLELNIKYAIEDSNINMRMIDNRIKFYQSLINHLEDRNIRFLVDDVVKFVKREIRRGNKYDIILMDPPSFGRGANKEVWNIEKDLFNLVELCGQLLSDDPILFLINSYSTGLSKTILENVLYLTVGKNNKGIISSDELGILMKDSNLILPCGIYARWEKNNLN